LILVDTSVWIEHFRSSNPSLCKLLEDGNVLTHSFVLGEIACGNIKNRKQIIGFMQSLPVAVRANDEETLDFIETHALMGRGIGLIDAHLLASCLLTPCSLWTFDKRLWALAVKLEVALGHPR